jgi:hypothetical protein
MLVVQALYHPRLQIIVKASTGRQHVPHVTAQVAAEPDGERHAEPHLASLHDLCGDDVRERVQDSLGLRAAPLEAVGELAQDSTSAGAHNKISRRSSSKSIPILWNYPAARVSEHEVQPA